MPKFKQGDKVVISSECKDEQYHGISGTVLGTYPSGDGFDNRVGLDKPVNNDCVFWFTDHELQDANKLVSMSVEQKENIRWN